jgi:hypothetical protein
MDSSPFFFGTVQKENQVKRIKFLDENENSEPQFGQGVCQAQWNRFGEEEGKAKSAFKKPSH